MPSRPMRRTALCLSQHPLSFEWRRPWSCSGSHLDVFYAGARRKAGTPGASGGHRRCVSWIATVDAFQTLGVHASGAYPRGTIGGLAGADGSVWRGCGLEWLRGGLRPSFAQAAPHLPHPFYYGNTGLPSWEPCRWGHSTWDPVRALSDYRRGLALGRPAVSGTLSAGGLPV